MPVAIPTPLSTATPRPVIPNPPIRPGSPLKILSLDDPALFAFPSDLHTFRTVLSLQYRAGGSTAGITAEAAYQATGESKAIHFMPFGAGVLPGEESIRLVDIASVRYISSELTGCVTADPDELQVPYSRYLAPGDFLTGKADFIAGSPPGQLPALFIYRLRQDNFLPQPALEIASVEQATLAILQEGGFPIRLQVTGSGSARLLAGPESETGTIDYALEHKGFGLLQDFELPPGCTDLNGSGSEVPFPPDSEGVTRLPGFLTFTTRLSLDAVDDFYREALEPLGWLPYDAAINEVEGTILYRNSAGDELTVTIAPEPDTGITTVVVFEGTP